MSVNLAIYENFINNVIDTIPQGMSIETYLKICFFVYDQDPLTGMIRISDQSSQISQYNPLTDVHEIFVRVQKEECDGCINDCFLGPMIPFSNLSYQLPCEGNYRIEIDVRYTIQWDDGFGNIIPYTFQHIIVYPITWERSGDYHNTLMYDIKCRIAKLECQILKRRKVGRDSTDLQHRVFALNTYLYAICNLGFDVEEFDAISCKVKTIKKVC